MSRLAAVAIALAVGVFTALTSVAMRLYPGGTWFNRHARGHSFWFNFLCDLHHTPALNGAPNALGARLAQAGMLALVLGFVPFFLVLPQTVPERPRLGRIARASGLLAVLGMVAVPLTPSDHYGLWHAAAVVIAGVPGLLAAGLGAFALVTTRTTPRSVRVVATTTMLFAVVDLALYVSAQARGREVSVLTPVFQRVALAGVLLWMLWSAARVWRSSAHDAR